ncbi:MAG: ATP-dependent DNA helicase UvrD2 [Aeromicrobium erythreum]
MPDPEDLLSALDPEQRAVATALQGPVSVVAGAGTGKTRAITHRIAYGVATGLYEPTEVLAVTFTTRAAGEMRGRLARLGAGAVQARTFHSAALRQARYFWPHVYGTEFPDIVQSKLGLVGPAARRLGLSTDIALLRDLSAEIEWAKVSNVLPQDYAATARRRGREVADVDPATVGNLLAAYEELKRERHVIDMEDILLVTAAILADDERVAAQVRRQYRWFVVDEFQDVNPLQSMLLDLWLGGREDVCVVGDPRQTIYSFAGASPGLLTGFTERYPSAQRLQLVRNYRSTPQVVAVANAVFPRGAEPGVRLESQQAAGEPVRYQGHRDEPAEAAAVADEIVRRHRDGVPYREMAILYRVNAQSESFEEALGERGVPFSLRGAEGFFQRAEVRQAVTLLRGAAQASEGQVQSLPDEVRAVLATIDYTDTAPSGSGERRNRWESLHAIVSMAADLAQDDPTAGVATLVADLDRRAQVAHAPAGDGVTLSTMHAAKGLEWDVVFCAGMHEGTMPSPHAKTPVAVDEERRLFYVGLTRARHVLTVSWSAARKQGGRGNRRPTRFLDPLLPADHESRRTGQPKPRRKTSAVLDELEPGDRALFERLKEWRTEQAGEAKVPAYVIFTDATLLGIVQARPGDAHDLVGIPGIGATKRERFGDDVLRIVAEA